MEKNRNLYYQKQAQNQISQQTDRSFAFLTSALNNHLNIGQNFTINASSVFMSLQVTSTESLSNQIIKPIGNAKIQLPSTIQSNDCPVSLRVCFSSSDFSFLLSSLILVNCSTTCTGRSVAFIYESFQNYFPFDS